MEKVVEIKGLRFCYPDGKCALKGVDLAVCEGEKVGLVGPNGAGKSTLLLHFNGTLRSDGAVRLFGSVVSNSSLKLVRRQVGLVFQEPDDQLFSPTVYDDVAFGPLNMGCDRGEIGRMVSDALDKVGLSGYEGRAPHHLSVGEKKRVAIAAVMVMNPRLLVLDEPTANLDPRSRWNLVELLEGLPVTMIVASHDLEAVQFLCSRVVVLDGGQVAADGQAGRILSDLPLLRSHGLARVEAGAA